MSKTSSTTAGAATTPNPVQVADLEHRAKLLDEGQKKLEADRAAFDKERAAFNTYRREQMADIEAIRAGKPGTKLEPVAEAKLLAPDSLVGTTIDGQKIGESREVTVRGADKIAQLCESHGFELVK